jgi:putative spermidine/putrescine transport system substrate-binding protein
MSVRRMWNGLAFVVVLALLLSACAPAATPTPQVIIKEATKIVEKEVTPVPPPPAPTEITLVDTNSGANFQWYWQNVVVPSIQEQLGIKVNYVVGKIAELTERMKAWETGKGDVHLLFLKPEDNANLVQQNIPLVKVWPDRKTEIPNLAKCREDYLTLAQGVDIKGTGALYWRSQYTLVYNTEYVKNPPKRWKEFYERRAEWKGHIGWMRPDSKSGSGRSLPYTFLNAYVPLTDAQGKAIPLADLQAKAEFQDAVTKLKDFITYCKVASEPTNMFEDFNAGDTWIAVYAMDYSLWSISQGTMPPTLAAAALSDGMPAGSDGYLAIPDNIPAEYKPVVMKVINYLLSDDQQIRLITTMWQYTGTEIWDKIPDVVWRKIPKWEDVEKYRVRLSNKEVTDWIKAEGLKVLLGQ